MDRTIPKSAAPSGMETVFSYPGIGTLSYESARYQDYNLLMLLCILSGTVVIFCKHPKSSAASIVMEITGFPVYHPGFFGGDG